MKLILCFVFALFFTVNLDLIEAEQTPRDVGFINKYIVNFNDQNFEIVFGSNFQITSHEFIARDNTLQFNIEAGLDYENIGEIIIPRDLIDNPFIVLLDGEKISHKVSDTTKTSVVTVIFDDKGKHTLEIIPDESNGGGCLIATASFGSEISSEVQYLRELRDQKILQTKSGEMFMSSFNQFYYLFSPTIADYERENSTFKEVVKITVTPLIYSLTILQYTNIDSESEMLGYGIGVILLNIGMYFVAPTIIIRKIRKRVNIEKLDEKHA